MEDLMKQMRLFFNITMITFLALAAVANTPATVATAQEINTPDGDALFVPGELVIGFSEGLSAQAYDMQALTLAGEVSAQVLDTSGNMVLLGFAEDADIVSLAEQASAMEGISFAEPNYIYAIPEPVASTHDNKVQTEFVVRAAPEGMETDGKDWVGIPISALQAMKTKRGGKIQATYPNDPYLWWNGGWDWVGGSIVWPNKTASAGVCVLDTGVDYTHPDFKYKKPDGTTGFRVLKGYDFVNGDADPMDDFGHGTHVAGIIAAQGNNKQGMSGISTGPVIAVKVLGSQGWGTNFDIAAGIGYCANRNDVKVLNLSLGGGFPSSAVHDAIDYAVNLKGKLVVASAGNSNTDTPSYPAGFAAYPEFENKVISVAASGQWYEDDDEEWWLDYNCRADYSNYGDWVSVSAPGTSIYSTMPWDKPFYMSYYYGFDTRYDSMSGTSMAAPFVAASAARRWGYKPTSTNAQIGADVIGISPMQTWDYDSDGECWPAEMDGKSHVNVAALLERGAASGQIFDASAGTPLTGAKLMLYQGTSVRGTGVITPNTWGPYPWEQDPTRVYMSFTSWTDVINLPAGSGYTAKAQKNGYTVSTPQEVFQSTVWFTDIWPGEWGYVGKTAIPPKSTNFDAVVGWWNWYRDDTPIPFAYSNDLDINVWLPSVPNPLDPGQPAQFIVGWEGDFGAMTAFPFARFKRDGGGMDWLSFENTTISSRKAHAPLAANSALPYYPGTYTVMVTDWGQTIDHDDDEFTDEIPLMGVYMTPWVHIWKDGFVKAFAMMDLQDPGEPCNAEWWEAIRISSGVSGSPTYTVVNTCGDGSSVPYNSVVPSSGLSK
jgi:hypothetical protein